MSRQPSHRVVIHGDRARGFRWTLHGRNGLRIAESSRSYKTTKSAERAIESATDAIRDAPLEVHDWDKMP